MENWYIYLDCCDTMGYFTGIIYTSTNVEVGVHPYKTRAYRFDSKKKAFDTAAQLKNRFSCIKSYKIIN